MQVLSVRKEFNLKLHYSSVHGEKFNKYDWESRVTLANDFKKKLNRQTGMFTKVAKVQTCSLSASYTVALELAKSKRTFIHGHLVKKCAIEIAKVTAAWQKSLKLYPCLIKQWREEQLIWMNMSEVDFVM
jgi:hypothetical protein